MLKNRTVPFKVFLGTRKTLGGIVLILAVVSVVTVAGCATVGTITTPMPETLTITPPPANLPPQLAAFSGIWEGTSDAGYDVRLVVENIDSNQATVVYALGDHPRGIFRGNWVRVSARVIDGNALQWEQAGGVGRRHFWISRNLKWLHGRMEWGHLSATVTLRRVK